MRRRALPDDVAPYRCLFREKNADSGRQARYDASTRCMTPCSAATLLCGAALLPALGQPAVSTRLAAAMTGEALFRFEAFAWENLRGGAISLAIGAAVYLGFARPVLCKGGVYRDLWPKRIDLEDAFYRPLLLEWLPAVLGAPARWLGENALLTPLCRALAFAGSLIGRILDSGTDAFVLLLRRTALREEKVRNERSLRPGDRRGTLRRATGLALSRVLENFSYAMMMTCLGIILIFGVLTLELLRRAGV